jgi:hypothetical protein
MKEAIVPPLHLETKAITNNNANLLRKSHKYSLKYRSPLSFDVDVIITNLTASEPQPIRTYPFLRCPLLYEFLSFSPFHIYKKSTKTLTTNGLS